MQQVCGFSDLDEGNRSELRGKKYVFFFPFLAWNARRRKESP